MKKNISILELKKLIKKGKIRPYRTSWARGYISRKKPVLLAGYYKGKYGEGYTVAEPSYNSTRYYFITYYILNH